MGKIAILDTDICERDLHCNTFRQYKVRNGTTGCSDMEEFSHGTVCAMLLDRNTTNYDLVSVSVLENEPGDGGKLWGSIEDLREGLLLCRELDVDMICLSAGSTILSDAAAIYEITRELAEDKIILAVQDNRQFITVPACIPPPARQQSSMPEPGYVPRFRRTCFLCRHTIKQI